MSDDEKYDKIVSELNDLMEIFQPREHWSNPGIFSSPICTRVLSVIRAGLENGGITLEKEVIPELEKLPTLMEEDLFDDADQKAYSLVLRRRGKEDLKLDTWAAYLHLKNKFKDGVFVTHGYNAPYYYEEVNSKSIILAGNVEPERIIEIVMVNGYRRLSIVGYPSEQRGQYSYYLPGYEISTFTFDPLFLRKIGRLIEF